jgi:hypothetical protein
MRGMVGNVIKNFPDNLANVFSDPVNISPDPFYVLAHPVENDPEEKQAGR